VGAIAQILKTQIAKLHAQSRTEERTRMELEEIRSSDSSSRGFKAVAAELGVRWFYQRGIDHRFDILSDSSRQLKEDHAISRSSSMREIEGSRTKNGEDVKGLIRRLASCLGL